ncbi:MAG UNVERIFIED_CONTAM: hypothetical protein LVR18_32355 [Planctomycetaceae bacterium]|jgi:hypothetical protein
MRVLSGQRFTGDGFRHEPRVISAGNRRKLLQFSTIEDGKRQLQSDRQNRFLRRMAKNVFEEGEDQLTDTVFPLILAPANLARVPVAIVILNFCDAFASRSPAPGGMVFTISGQ